MAVTVRSIARPDTQSHGKWQFHCEAKCVANDTKGLKLQQNLNQAFVTLMLKTIIEIVIITVLQHTIPSNSLHVNEMHFKSWSLLNI